MGCTCTMYQAFLSLKTSMTPTMFGWSEQRWCSQISFSTSAWTQSEVIRAKMLKDIPYLLHGL